jgi:DNA polymerase Ligase (LigD)
VPRFVILEHDHPTLHWDLMLESGDVLRTWRLAEPPEHAGPIGATSLADHRRAYLDYEGPVSGNRGTVKRWDAGTFEIVDEGERGLELRLDGQRVRGVCRLMREGDAWRFQWGTAG